MSILKLTVAPFLNLIEPATQPSALATRLTQSEAWLDVGTQRQRHMGLGYITGMHGVYLHNSIIQWIWRCPLQSARCWSGEHQSVLGVGSLCTLSEITRGNYHINGVNNWLPHDELHSGSSRSYVPRLAPRETLLLWSCCLVLFLSIALFCNYITISFYLCVNACLCHAWCSCLCPIASPCHSHTVSL